MDSVTEILAALLRIDQRLTQIERRLGGDVIRPRRDADLEDRAKLEALLPAIRGEFGSAWIFTADLVDSPVTRGLTPPAIGQLLARAARSGVVIAGLRVESSVDKVGNARLWRIVEVVST